MPIRAVSKSNTLDRPKKLSDKDQIKEHISSELFFAIVAPVGAGASKVAEQLCNIYNGQGKQAKIFKASDIIRDWALANGKITVKEQEDLTKKTLDNKTRLQNFGDEMRKVSSTAISIEFIKKVKEVRSENIQVFILDSIKNPEEVNVLKTLYGSAFTLIGVVCDDKIRQERIQEKYLSGAEKKDDVSQKKISDFIDRDSKDTTYSYGQQVIKCFYESDFFVNNTQNKDNEESSDITESLDRLVKITEHSSIERPTVYEYAMYHAYAAKLQSACLSRQVGASLVNDKGDVIATGTNEVPSPGGGVYGEHFSDVNQHSNTPDRSCDHRCAYSEKKCVVVISNKI